MIKTILTAAALLLTVGTASATNYNGFSVSSNSFLMKPGNAGFGSSSLADIRYSPTGSGSANALSILMHAQPHPLHLLLMGYPEGYPMGAHGFNWFRAFTGMSGQTGMTGGGMRWYPRNPANNNQYGSQHAEISSTQGLGMYVQSGGSNFMAIKRYGSGPDRQENYARVYTGGLGMKPWSGTQKILRFSSQQQVSQVSAPGTSHGLQKVAFVVTNKTSGHTFEYSLAVMSTSTASNHVSWDVPTSTYYVGGGVQNGVSPTKTHSASGYTATLFSGTGIGTQSGAFPLGTFSFDVSWDNFVSVLRYITYSNNMDGSVNSNVATLFGSNWSSRTNWELRAVRFGQEINNPDYTTYTATIGGRTKELKLDAL